MERISQLHGYSASKHTAMRGADHSRGWGLVEGLEFGAPTPPTPFPELSGPQESQCLGELGRLEPRQGLTQAWRQSGPF